MKLFKNRKEAKRHALGKNFNFHFRISKIWSYLVGFADFRYTKFMFAPPNICLLLLRLFILNIYIVSISGNLNGLNALSACHKLEPTGNAQSLSLGFI